MDEKKACKRTLKEDPNDRPAINAHVSSGSPTDDEPPAAYRSCMPVPGENMSKPVFEMISGYTAWKNDNHCVLAELAEFAAFHASLERGQTITYRDIEYEVEAILCLNIASNKILHDLQLLATTSSEDQQHRKKEYEEISSVLASHEKMQKVILALRKIDLFFESHKAVKDDQILEDAAHMHDQYIGDTVRRFCHFRNTVRFVLNKLAHAFHTMQKEERRHE